MAKINEVQVIQFLKNKKEDLQKELAKIETALNALNESEPIKRPYSRRSKTAGKKPGKQKQQTQPENPRNNNSPSPQQPAFVQTRRKKPEKPTLGVNRPKTSPSLDMRIIAALDKIGPSSKEEIIKHLATQEPTGNQVNLSRALPLRLSVMKKNGKLKSVKTGDLEKFSH